VDATETLNLHREPTVTLSTRAAFDELNAMFRSDLPHEQGRANHTGRLGAVRPPLAGRRSMAPTNYLSGMGNTLTLGNLGRNPLAARAHQETSGMGETGGLGVYEDTELLNRPQGGGAAAGNFAVYEDTQLLDGTRQTEAQASGVATLPGDCGLAVYEDTQFLDGTRSLGAGTDVGGGGFEVYEDTQFVTRPIISDSPLRAEGGLQVYEDTQFVNAVAASVEGHGLGNDAAFELYQDTQFLDLPTGGGCSPMNGGLQIYEDTQFVNAIAATVEDPQAAIGYK
jgi:hypothetical protein